MGDKNIEAIYRLSPLQEGVLFHTLESTGSGIYFQQYSCEFNQPIDTSQLVNAWDRVVVRHPVLRTLFTWEQRNQPLQIVRHRVSVPWQHLDWSNQTETEQEIQWSSLLQRDRDRGFELTSAPLIRLALIQLDRHHYRLLWSFHHLLLDGWSVRLILDEVALLYRQLLTGAEAPLPNACPYARFIGWLEKRDASNDRTYWTELLKGFSSPTQPPRVGGQGTLSRGHGVESMEIDSANLKRLDNYARGERLTLNTLVVGAWALVLGRYCNTDDVVFGATVSGRPPDLEGVETAAGLFINTLPTRVKITDDHPATWLQGIQRQQLKTREFELSALSEIQRCSELAPGTPLFQSILVFENFPPRSAAIAARAALGVSNEVFVEYSNFPLAMLVVPGDRLELILVYDRAHYDSRFSRRILEHLQSTLLNILEETTQPVSCLPIYSRDERHKLLVEWNGARADYPSALGIHQLIEQAVERSPHSIAVNYPQQQITYDELNRRANQLAHYIVKRGIKKGTLVPILLERSIEAVVAILGILKAGSAYVPLDPAYPSERLALLLSDLAQSESGRSSILITSTRLMSEVSSGNYPALCIDGDWREIASAEEDNPQLGVDDGQLVYVIFTSGTTGHPKGVLVPHASLVNSTLARQRYYSNPPERFLLLSSLATDSSVAGIFWTLVQGGTLVLPANRAEQDILNLCDLIASEQVSHLLCVPSLYLLILDYSTEAQLKSLATAIVAGEACSGHLVEKHKARMPNTPLFNEYGPTEATVWATACRLDDLPPGRRIPIGRPIQNTTIYLLDKHKQPSPIGLAGELCIGGAGVAQGYLDQSQKSNERFIPNPFRHTPDPLLYRTGDLARYRDDGTIEFLGRVDNQVKIRGYRVELEEVESVLAEHPAVREVAVTYDSPQQTVDTPETQPTVEMLEQALDSLDSDEAERLLSDAERLEEFQVLAEISALSNP